MCAKAIVRNSKNRKRKKLAIGNPFEDLKLAINTIGSLMRATAIKKDMNKLNV
ncbi:hypothetical protein Fmac_026395 [Flemingia macrophylla]|uniref:Uncharacterized protein n=1 Tax=Flemingia macrophylla TaxID=520843 RepID=A0ABD1LER3_9FABA